MDKILIPFVCALAAAAAYKYGYISQYIIGFVIFAVIWLAFGARCQKRRTLVEIGNNVNYNHLAVYTVIEVFLGSAAGFLLSILLI